MFKVEATKAKLSGMSDQDIVMGIRTGSLKREIIETGKSLTEMMPIYKKVPEMLFLSIIPTSKRSLFVEYKELKQAYDSYIEELTMH